ncbi:hypothetical protein ONZ45_g4410 [Pleurotus djamor]|nr:hypothetical protein ONZ45_g4410 [Pleurotus djamor]
MPEFALAVTERADEVDEPITDETHIHGLEIQRVPFRSLRLDSVHPTDPEIALFESSPLVKTNVVFATALKRLRTTTFDIGERVIVVAGPYKGLSGVIKDVNNRYVMITVSQTPDFGLFEIPLEDFLRPPAEIGVNSFSTIFKGPYAGFAGYIRTITASCTIVEPTTSFHLDIDVQVWNLCRDIQVGEYVTIIQGDYQGSSGFVVAIDMPVVEVYLCDFVQQLEDPQIVPASILRVRPSSPPSKYVDERAEIKLDHMERKEKFAGMEVTIRNHPILKGLDGYIVGHRYETRIVNSHSVEVLVCEVNTGINITSFTAGVDGEDLYEKYYQLPRLFTYLADFVTPSTYTVHIFIHHHPQMRIFG